MIKRWIAGTAAVGFAAAVLTGSASAEAPLKRHELLKHARIALEQARATALKAHPGQVTDEALERAPNGSGYLYSFTIKGPTGVSQVAVDANSGKLLPNVPPAGHAG
jgi:uncharacterized membrane protein YkoI